MAKNHKSTEDQVREVILAYNQQVLRARQSSEFSGTLAKFDFQTCDKKIQYLTKSENVEEIFGSAILLLANLEIINNLSRDLGKNLGKNKSQFINEVVSRSEVLLGEIKLAINSDLEGNIN